MTMRPFVPPVDLLAAVRRQTAQALASGALQPIETTVQRLNRGGIGFVVRVAANLRLKDAARAREIAAVSHTGERPNPFLPYEPAMFVADLPPAHVCLLNKYNVLDQHLLIVTREYFDQEMLITGADFEALCVCMQQIDGLALYNAGPDAGASQPHKHLQLIPLPWAANGPAIPIEPALSAVNAKADAVATVPAFTFRHALSRLESTWFAHPAVAASHLLAVYHRLLNAVDIGEQADGNGRQSRAYNLLLTRRWMLVVPRATEFFAGISISALNFAGSLFVRSDEQLRIIDEAGPMAVLAGVAFPANPVSDETPPPAPDAPTRETGRRE